MSSDKLQKKMKEIAIRSLTGAVYVGIILTSLIIHPLAFAILSTLIVFIAAKELQNVFDKSHLPEFWYYVMSILFLLSVFLVYFKSYDPISLIPLLLILILSQIGSLYRKSNNTLDLLLTVSFFFVYVVLPLYLLNTIHNYSIVQGIPYTLAIFILIWTNDTFAYLAGVAFGRHILFERISPRKTWEGVIGGIGMTVVASYFIFTFFPTVGLPQWLIFGLLVSFASVFGDFIESMLKRSAHMKDTGNLLPGHGGLLDRIDSLLLVSPVIYGYIFLILK
jgi:phosphatidate cytidylyltransferase